MAIVETEGVVTKCRKFRETSLIVSSYTRELGMLRAVAKGARGPKSRFKSSPDLFVVGRMVVYVKDDRELQLLSDFEASRYFNGIQRDFKRFAFASAAVELLEALVAGEEAHEELYSLLLDYLAAVESVAVGSLYPVFRAFQLRACGLLGYGPEVSRCASCGSDTGLSRFSPRAGGAVCAGCARESFGAARVDDCTLSELRRMQHASFREVAEAAADGVSVERRVGPLLEAFLQYHVDRYRGLKSLSVLRRSEASGREPVPAGGSGEEGGIR